MKSSLRVSSIALLAAVVAPAQCPLTAVVTQSVVPGSCHGLSQLAVSLQACSLQADFVLPPPSPNTYRAWYLLGFGWNLPPAPCDWLPLPTAVLLLPGSAAPSWTIPVPPGLVVPLTFLMQGAVVSGSTLSGSVGIGQVGTLQITLS